MLGSPVGRPGVPNVILRLHRDGAHGIASLPEGQPADLSVEADAKVHAVVMPQPRTSDPVSVECDRPLSGCVATALAKDGRHVRSRRFVAGRVAELSLDGTLYLDGVPVLAASTETGRIVPNRLLVSPGGSRLVRLNQATGALTMLDPLWPIEPLDVTIQHAESRIVAQPDSTAPASAALDGSSAAMTVYAAAAAEDGSLFLALSPVHGYAGPTILQTTPGGKILRTIRCALPISASGKPAAVPAYIGVSGSQLCLISPTGDLLTYNL